MQFLLAQQHELDPRRFQTQMGKTSETQRHIHNRNTENTNTRSKNRENQDKDRNFYLNIASFLDSSDDRTLISQLSVTHCWNHHIDLLYRLHKALMVVEITLKTITKNNRTKIKQNPNVRSSWKIWKSQEILHTKTKLTPKDLKFSMTLALAGLERVGSRTRA